MFILAAGQIKIIFVQNTEALRRLHSHQFSIGQTPERAGDLCECLGTLAGFVCGHGMLRAVLRKPFASRLLQAV